MGFRTQSIAAAMAVAAVSAAPVQAAPVSPNQNASGRALILVPLALTKIDDLSFGTLIPSASVGVVTLDATTGARATFGGVTGVPSDVGQRAYFAGAGTPNQQVIISYIAPTQLTSTTNAADKVQVLALTLDGSPVRTINPATRTFFFGMGGIILINANQPDGLYEATFDVTANYQ